MFQREIFAAKQGVFVMGRKLRRSESVWDVEGLLNQALVILDASGMLLTAIHVDMAKNTLMKELVAINSPATRNPKTNPVDDAPDIRLGE